ncbi:MAG: S-adenosylmethionine decarboxylase [Gemmataceae bacterium]
MNNSLASVTPNRDPKGLAGGRMAGFGIHLTLDLGECDSTRLSDLDRLFELLNQLPEMLCMTRVTPPYVFKYSGKVPEDRGITGFVVIAESHISIHTFQEKNYAFVDVFSCKAFDWNQAKTFIADCLGARNVVANMVIRGRDFPRPSSAQVISSQALNCHHDERKERP